MYHYYQDEMKIAGVGYVCRNCGGVFFSGLFVCFK